MRDFENPAVTSAKGCFLVFWACMSVAAFFHPEPWGEFASVINGLNLLCVVLVALAVPVVAFSWAKERAWAAGHKQGMEEAAGVLKSHRDLALLLASKGHKITAKGFEVKP